MYRDHTKVIQIGDRKIGGGNPILIQSMTNTKTEDVEQTVAQILALEQAGCDIIRCAVPTMEAAKALKEIKNRSIYHLWQIFILIIVLPLQPWKTVQIRSGLIPEISAVQSELKQWLMWQRSEEYPFVLV